MNINVLAHCSYEGRVVHAGLYTPHVKVQYVHLDVINILFTRVCGGHFPICREIMEQNKQKFNKKCAFNSGELKASLSMDGSHFIVNTPYEYNKVGTCFALTKCTCQRTPILCRGLALRRKKIKGECIRISLKNM
eukprot:XP_002257546.1 hypothetical protein PKH_010495 [Plasmodium knowlesi strain H]